MAETLTIKGETFYLLDADEYRRLTGGELPRLPEATLKDCDRLYTERNLPGVRAVLSSDPSAFMNLVWPETRAHSG